ncbi:MAG: alpha/beta hydrolase, partial [Rhodospirillaceae bacterium]|nr:alpha/beta hydrolase [Rhodospirillaceae bacterium]
MGGRLPVLVAVLVWAGTAVPGAGQQVGDFREVSFPTSDGGVIFANLYGEGAHAVLLAHGAVFEKQSWDAVARQLAAAGYRVLAIDFRGYGKSRAGRARG